MQQKSSAGVTERPEFVDPDDAPELTEEFFTDAEVFEGDKFVRRGRGRPATGHAREIVSFRLDQELVAKLREAGPGWQSRVNGLLRAALKSEAASASPPEASEEMHIDVTLIRLNRSLAAERSTGVSVKSGVARIDYPLGSFELTVKTDSWSSTALEKAVADQLQVVGRALTQFDGKRLQGHLPKAKIERKTKTRNNTT